MRKIGLETVSFSSPEPPSATMDNLLRSSGPEGGTAEGLVLKARQVQTCTYGMDLARFVSLTVELKATEGGATSKVSISWNKLALASRQVVAGADPTVLTWVIPTSETIEGANVIRVSVDQGQVSLMAIRVGNFQIQQQQRSNWCWIASALSVSEYLDRERASATQCQLYDAIHLAASPGDKSYQSSCPSDPAMPDPTPVGGSPSDPDPYNSTGWPTVPLERLGHAPLVPSTTPLTPPQPRQEGKPVEWETVITELANNRPLICIIAWYTGGKHAVVLSLATAYQDERWVMVEDPLKGSRSYMTYGTLLNAYKNAGRWIQTIYTE